MTIIVSIDSQLLAEAMDLSNSTSEVTTVTEALTEFIQHHKQLRTIELFGTIEFDPNYDYKKERQRKMNRLQSDDD